MASAVVASMAPPSPSEQSRSTATRRGQQHRVTLLLNAAEMVSASWTEGELRIVIQQASSKGWGRLGRCVVVALIVAIFLSSKPHDVDEASAGSRACAQIMAEHQPKQVDGGDDGC